MQWWHWLLKNGAPFAIYGFMLDSYGAAAVSFDLAIQQKGNNSTRSPKGERLQMNVESVQRASTRPAQRQKIHVQKWKISRSVHNLVYKNQTNAVCSIQTKHGNKSLLAIFHNEI